MRLAGVARSKRAAIDPMGLDLGSWREVLESGTSSASGMLEQVLESDHPSRIFVDATASGEVIEAYEPLLQDGVAVISANKLAFSSSMERFQTLRVLGAQGMGIFFETTVGAGLPVLRTIEDLISTGDTIQRIEGVLSGTLSFICDRLMVGTPFSAALREADERGFTEPDPREDLARPGRGAEARDPGTHGGLLVGDGRRGGRAAPPGPAVGDGAARSLLGEASRGRRRVQRAPRGRGGRRHGARLPGLGGGRPSHRAHDGRASQPRLQPDSPGSENLIAITSRRYAETPLVVRGPGAGPEVTAAGVFADVLRALAESS